LTQLVGNQFAAIGFAEPLATMARDDIVENIADGLD
jgi:hypothetical protein